MDTMRDWARSKDERKKDWDAAARNWLRRRNDEPHQRPNTTGPPKQKSVITLAAEGLRELRAEMEEAKRNEQFTGSTLDLAVVQARGSKASNS
jgi:hypothetical protein